MKVQVEKVALSNVLSFCQSIAEKRSTMPILSHGLISASGDTLTITTTDLEVYATATISCQVEGEGTFCIPVKSFTSIVKDLSSDEIQLSLNENQSLELSSGSASFRLNTLPHEDFPIFDVKHAEKGICVNSTHLKSALEHTLISVSSDETQIILNSVLFDLSDSNEWKIASTDRHRLSVFDMTQYGHESEDLLSKGQYILPKKGAFEVKKLCELIGEDKNISIFESNKVLCFQHENFNLYVRLMDGDFPAFKHIVDVQDDFSEFIINREQLMSALKRTSLLSSEKLRAIQLTFSHEKVELYCTSETLGDAREALTPDEINAFDEGKSVVATLNSRYLIEPLSVLTGDQVKILIRDKETHMILLPEDGSHYRALIMPLRV